MKVGVSLQPAWVGRNTTRAARTGNVRESPQAEPQTEGEAPAGFKRNTSLINATCCLALMKQINKAIGAHMATEISID